MDKNIAAILRTDTKTIKVCFDDSANAKTYMYVTDQQVAEGDHVVVKVGNDFKVVRVIEAHEDLRILPNSDIHYKWIVGKVDMSNYEQNAEKNRQIEKTISDAYQAQVRRSFAQSVIQDLPDSDKVRIHALIGG